MGGKSARMAKAIVIYSPWQFIFWYDRTEGSPFKTGEAGANAAFIKERKIIANSGLTIIIGEK